MQDASLKCNGIFTSIATSTSIPSVTFCISLPQDGIKASFFWRSFCYCGLMAGSLPHFLIPGSFPHYLVAGEAEKVPGESRGLRMGDSG